MDTAESLVIPYAGQIIFVVPWEGRYSFDTMSTISLPLVPVSCVGRPVLFRASTHGNQAAFI